MRYAALMMFALLAVSRLTADDAPVIDITTADGNLYANATVLNVNASTVDISYLDSNSMPVISCLPLKNLTADLQAKFNYDPTAAADSARKQAQWRQDEFARLQSQQTQLVKQISTQVMQRQGGQTVPIDLNDLYDVIYGGKTAVAGFVISYSQAGALVNVSGSSGGTAVADNIIILDLDAPAQSNWAGYVYPTMMISSQRLNIYCVHPANAVNSVITTLKLDNGNGGNGASASDAAANAPTTAVTDNSAVSASPAGNNSNISSTVIDPNTNAAIPAVNNVYINGGGYYGGGGYVYPAAIQPFLRPWPHPLYNNNNWNNNWNNNNWSNRNNFNNGENRGGEIRPNETPGATGFTTPRSDFSGRGWGSGGGGGRGMRR